MNELLEGRFGQIAKAAGVILTIAALAFVVVRISQSPLDFKAAFSDPWFIAAIAAAAVAYALIYVLMALGWVILLHAANHTGTPSTRDGVLLYGHSQIFKYLPSNVLHFVGRYSMAKKAGASHTSLIFSTASETTLLAAAAATIGIVFALPLVLRHLSEAFNQSKIAIAILIVLVSFAVVCIWWLKRQDLLKPGLWRGVLAAFALFLAFFLLNGLLLWFLVVCTGTVGIPNTGMVLGIAAVAWLCGFVVPGAPAGIGIREAVLTSGLAMAGIGSGALAAVVGYRIATFTGDVLLAGTCALLRR